MNYNCGVYVITCLANGRVYIGSSCRVRRRFYLHKWELRRGEHRSSILQRAWNKYGEESFRFELVLACSEDDLLFYEKLLIKFYDATNRSTGMNLVEEPGRPPRVEWTAELRQKVSVAKLGRPIFRNNPEAHARMMAAVRRGKDHPRFGRTHTAESIAKLSASLKGRTAWNKGLTGIGTPRTPKGRKAIADGARNGRNAKLTMNTAREIRALTALGGLTQKEIASRFGVTPNAVHRVVRNISWIETRD